MILKSKVGSTFVLEGAIGSLEKRYDRNVKLILGNRLPGSGGCTNRRFRLRVWDSKAQGAARSASGRRTVSACWHAHGYFFEAIFAIDPDAVIISRGKKITKAGGNWEDFVAGYLTFIPKTPAELQASRPVMASECCNCGGDN